MKKLNKKGFTLAELLIVVAIIAVLVAIAIPVFNTQLEKSRDAVTESNIRAAYAQAASEILVDGDKDTSTTAIDSSAYKVTVKGHQKNGAFNSTALPFDITAIKDNLDQRASATSEDIQVVFTWSVDANGKVAEQPSVALKTTT